MDTEVQIRREILALAARKANEARLPQEVRSVGDLFRESDHLSSFEYMTLSYDTAALTGLTPERAQAIDNELRMIAHEALRLAIIEKGEAFVGLILAGARNHTHYLSSTL
jgi:hypothetical protein